MQSFLCSMDVLFKSKKGGQPEEECPHHWNKRDNEHFLVNTHTHTHTQLQVLASIALLPSLFS